MSSVNPNALTTAALLVSVVSGAAFYMTDRSANWFLVASGLAFVYGFLDALDGLIARMHNKTSSWGDFLDHSFDRLSAVFALGGLTLTKHLDDRLGLLLIIGTLYHGFLGTQMEASFGIRVYKGFGIAEALGLNIVYSLTAWTIHALGLPFWFREPLTGHVLSVSDTFAIAAYPLIVIGTLQRFWIARQLARDEKKYPGKKDASTS